MQALFFDLDGTLVDSSKGITESFQHTFDTLKVPQPDLKTIRSFMGPPLISSFESSGNFGRSSSDYLSPVLS